MKQCNNAGSNRGKRVNLADSFFNGPVKIPRGPIIGERRCFIPFLKCMSKRGK